MKHRPFPHYLHLLLPVLTLALLGTPQPAGASGHHHRAAAHHSPPVAPPATDEGNIRRAPLWQQLLATAREHTPPPTAPGAAVFYDALAALADAGGDPAIASPIFTAGEQTHWAIPPRTEASADFGPAAAWLWAYNHTQNPVMIAALRARADALLHTDPAQKERCARRWCSGADIYNGLPLLGGLTMATGDKRYQAEAEKRFTLAINEIFDPKNASFSSENGFAYAATARLLQTLPDNDPARHRTEALFRTLSARLAATQKPDGSWPGTMGGADAGGGFLVYGLAYGIRSGLLTGAPYRKAVGAGWQALRPGRDVGRTGAYLMAGAEMYRLANSAARAATVRFSGIAPAYARGSINLTGPVRSNFFTAGKFQFVTFYGPPQGGQVPVMIARRHADKGAWQVVSTPFSIADVFSSTGARDDHNLIAAGVDSAGFLHLAWGMHNAPLTYAVSDKPVTNHTLGSKGRLNLHHSTMTGHHEEAVTYPEFFTSPGGGLLFAWRNGGAGGGSGNGNDYLIRYDAARKSWQSVGEPLINGIDASVNGYRNRFAWSREGKLYLSWTFRDTPDWQTNHGIYLAHSDDGGKSWIAADGARLGASITVAEADAHARIVDLPQGSSLINQTDMTIAPDGAALIATWWAPAHAQGNHTRQYMLIRHQEGTDAPETINRTQTFQISRRSGSEEIDDSSAHVREMGRPLVLTDKTGRILIITRSTDAGKPLTDASNRLTVYWSQDMQRWEHTELARGNFGSAEPVYDRPRWLRDNRLDLLLQPTGQEAAASTLSILQWDEPAFFAATDAPPKP